MSDEEIKAQAVEAVRTHLELSEHTRIKTSLRNACLIIGAFISGTIAVCTFLNRISNSQDRIEASLLYKVPEAQLTGWANALERANRTVQLKDGTLGLIVPDPQQYRPTAPTASSQP